MKIVSGLFSNAVLQRNKNNKSAQPFSGECNADGDVLASVTKGSKVLAGFKNLKVGKASKGIFKGELAGLPVGGAYDITLSIVTKGVPSKESVKVKNVLVGDLWLLAGQSNMYGCGKLTPLPKPINEIRAYFLDEHWGVAKDPIHNSWISKAPVYGGKPDGKSPDASKGKGPGIAFANEMFKYSKVPQGLIPCALGGTTMTQWDPALKGDGDKSLYGATTNRLKKLGGKVAGLLWYQGCSDTDDKNVPLYTERTKNFISSIRKEVGDSSLPVVMVQIGRLCAIWSTDRAWNGIRHQQFEMPEKIKNLLTVPVIDLDLEDIIHLNGESQNRLGRRLANAMLSFKNKKYKKPIEFSSLSFDKEFSGSIIIKLAFKNVSGSLKSFGRADGFTLAMNDDYLNYQNGIDWLNTRSLDAPVACTDPYKIELKGSEVYIHTGMTPEELGRHYIAYGDGKNPNCSITDSEDRSIPAFKAELNMPIVVISRFLTEFEVSDPVYMAETESNMAYPSDFSKINFVRNVNNTESMYHPKRKELATPEEKIFYYRGRLNFKEAAEIELRFGYDGPIKVFADKVEIFKDMAGKNPIGCDKSVFKYKFSAGIHELVFVLASNKGSAWGVKFRTALPRGKKFIDLPAHLPIETK